MLLQHAILSLLVLHPSPVGSGGSFWKKNSSAKGSLAHFAPNRIRGIRSADLMLSCPAPARSPVTSTGTCMASKPERCSGVQERLMLLYLLHYGSRPTISKGNTLPKQPGLGAVAKYIHSPSSPKSAIRKYNRPGPEL